MATFDGFGPDLIEFYEGLAADNSRAYWQAHKSVYDAQVRGPLEGLAEGLEPEFGAAKVFRPHRDVRFSPDKRPYAEHASMAVQRPTGSALYLSVSAETLFVAGGMYAPSPDQLERFRRAVDAGLPADELDQAVATAACGGLELSDGNPVKTAPRGWSREHPRLDLLRRRSLTVGTRHEPAAWWHTAELLDVVRDAWHATGPLLDWCDRHIGAALEGPRR